MSMGAVFWLGVVLWGLYVTCCVIAYRNRRLLFYLMWTVGVFLLFITSGSVGAKVPEWIWDLWAASCLGLPVWWVVRARRKQELAQ